MMMPEGRAPQTLLELTKTANVFANVISTTVVNGQIVINAVCAFGGEVYWYRFHASSAFCSIRQIHRHIAENRYPFSVGVELVREIEKLMGW